MKTVRLSCSHALIKYLIEQKTIINGKKVNSQKLKLPSGKILKGKERKLFEISKIKLDVLKSELINSQ